MTLSEDEAIPSMFSHASFATSILYSLFPGRCGWNFIYVHFMKIMNMKILIFSIQNTSPWKEYQTISFIVSQHWLR